MKITTYFLLILTTLFVFSASSCSYIIDKNKKGEIRIEPLESIEKVDCNTDTLTQLEITKCEMEARLLELKY